MNVLVTGAQGYIGHYTVQKLLKLGHKVTALDNRANCIFHLTGVRRFQTSITHPELGRVLDGIDSIIHLADRSDWSTNPRQPVHLTQHNVLGTANLLGLANQKGVDRIVHVSAADVYGNLVGATENDPCMPVTFYGASKLAAEAVCRGFYQRGTELSILRLFNVWGRPGSHSVVNQFATGESDTLYGDGAQTRDFIFIDDVVEALILALDWDPGIYNIGTGEEVAVGGLWNMLNSIPPQTRLCRQQGTDEVQRISSDQSYTYQSTGWQPRTYISNLSSTQIKELCQ